ncbi:hypothetical protein ABE41_017160 [Fictibacillus arsenicus]|uniref:Gram-positive cocci surface proteins LPxTG domain-containing protein n=1 Tax=Fictibacillus arsenicus TaxID=255247 RepID=A0A1B1Z8M7_9BACL|nr:LPXTG cell wall anchor domain-containing protein [Fictibacillus arsenicus]ANX13741.1 hypothetical protein ABE41_017160 [Fictibacillus arsenicus]
MKKIIFFSFLYTCVLLLLTIIPVGSTGATKSSTVLNLSLFPQKQLFNISGFAPGDWAERKLIIKNDGNTNFFYNSTIKKVSGNDLLFKQLQLKISTPNEILYEGKISEFSTKSRFLSSFSEEILDVIIVFPYESGNEFQGLATEVEFILYADGRNNPPDDADPPDPPGNGDPPDPPDDGDPPDPPDDGDPPDPPDDGDPPDPPDDGDPPDPPDDGDPPDPPGDGDGTDPPPGTNEPPSNNPTPTKPADPPSKDTGSLPQTGEENPLFIILSGFFISLAGLGLLLIKKSIIPNPFKRG